MKKFIGFIAAVVIITSIAGGNAPANNTDVTADAPSTVEVSNETVAQRNAVRTARRYLGTFGFSRKGLEKQLAYEKFESDDIEYALCVMDNETDWAYQAERSAKSYNDTIGLSREQLKKQLAFDGYTDEQAEHGAAYVFDN